MSHIPSYLVNSLRVVIVLYTSLNPSSIALSTVKKLFFIDFRGRKGERGWGRGERNVTLLSLFLMHSLVVSCMRPDLGD